MNLLKIVTVLLLTSLVGLGQGIIGGPQNGLGPGGYLPQPIQSGIFGNVTGQAGWVVLCTTEAGDLFGNITTDSTGNFSLTLPPGNYVLTPTYRPPVAPGRPNPYYAISGPSITAKVTKNRFTFVLLGTSFPPLTVLTATDIGRTLSIPFGSTLAVTLPSNPSTGYRWQPVQLAGSALTLADSAYVANPVPYGVVGAGGYDTFYFNATKLGRQVVRLSYVRPWETKFSPAQNFAANINVVRGK